jgi:hypothetical protein
MASPPLSFWPVSHPLCHCRLLAANVYGESLAVIDFVVTTQPSKASRQYTVDFTEGKRVLFDDYEPDVLQSALVTHARKRLDEVDESLTELRNTIFNSISIITAAIGAVITALALFIGGKPETPAIMAQLSAPLLLSITALVVSACAFVIAVTKTKGLRLVSVRQQMRMS